MDREEAREMQGAQDDEFDLDEAQDEARSGRLRRIAAWFLLVDVILLILVGVVWQQRTHAQQPSDEEAREQERALRWAKRCGR